MVLIENPSKGGSRIKGSSKIKNDRRCPYEQTFRRHRESFNERCIWLLAFGFEDFAKTVGDV
jgi:hypothetical protein